MMRNKIKQTVIFAVLILIFSVFPFSNFTNFQGNVLLAEDISDDDQVETFIRPIGITYLNNYLYVTDNIDYTIRKINISTGVITIIAGECQTSGSDDGKGRSARFYFPTGITTDGKYLYVADDTESSLRKIDITTNIVSTPEGDFKPTAITYDGDNFYASQGDSVCKINISSGTSFIIAGNYSREGFADGKGDDARFNTPTFLVRNKKYLYVSDTLNHTIRQIDIDSGEVTTIAGKAGMEGFVDGKGHDARFNQPSGIVTDGKNLYVADTENHIIRKITIKTGEVSTIAGTPGVSGDDDGIGSTSKFNNPSGMATDGKNLYISDSTNRLIRKLSLSNGEVITVSGKRKHKRSSKLHQ